MSTRKNSISGDTVNVRFHQLKKNEKRQFTEDEEVQRDKDEKDYTDAATARAAMKKIIEIENEITPRRVREAILGTDSDWLKNKEAEIATERAKL